MIQNEVDERFMRLALDEARLALDKNETPVGAVIVREGRVISRGHNLRESEKNALSHAEIIAINAACRELLSWRLSGCTIYVTLEPCPMCAGAIINARLDRVVFGARDSKAGCMGSLIDLTKVQFNHTMPVLEGVLKEESGSLLREFFSRLRNE